MTRYRLTLTVFFAAICCLYGTGVALADIALNTDPALRRPT